MTNEALKAFIEEFKAKMFLIMLDNNHKIMFGIKEMFPKTIYYTNIEYKTVGGVDMFGITRTDSTWNGNAVTYTNWYVTGCIQMISVTADDSDGGYLPDLNKFF